MANSETFGGVEYFDRFDPLSAGEGTPDSKRWDKLLARSGVVLQSAELNEMQSIQSYYLKNLGSSIFKDGDVVSGLNLYKVKEDGTTFINVLAGRVFLDGKVRQIPQQNKVRIDNTGNEILTLVRDINYITEGDDVTLRDPSEGFDNYNQPGAHRRRFDYTWRRYKQGSDTTAVTIFELIDGAQKTISRGVSFTRVYEAMARRTFDESGNYMMRPFPVSVRTNPSDSTTMIATINPGKAYVRGFEVELGTSQNVIFERARNSKTITEEAHTFHPNHDWKSPSDKWTLIYELDNEHVRQINTVEGVVLRNQTVTHAIGVDDTLTNTPVEDIYQIVDNGASFDSTRHKYFSVITPYVEGVDWHIDGNNIVWDVDPGAIDVLVVYGQRVSSLTKAVRTKTRVNAQAITKGGGRYDIVGVATQNMDGIGAVRITDTATAADPTWIEDFDYKFITGRDADDNTMPKLPDAPRDNHTPDWEKEITWIIIDWGLHGKTPGTGSVYYVTYDYWTHTTEGDFVSADSYTSYDDVDSISASSNFTDTDLRDTVDFRGLGRRSYIATKLDLVPGENFLTSYEYYLARIDLIWMDEDGTIKVKKGSPGISPRLPDLPAGGIAIAYLYVGPYTQAVSDVEIRSTKNRRYTMTDIGDIEDRVKRMEYFQATQLLEDNALGKFTTSEKRGIFTDTFVGTRQSDLDYNDGTRTYEVAVDPTKEELRLGFKMDTSVLTISTYPEGNEDYWENTLTLPVTEKLLFEQPYATASESVQPFEVFDAAGELELTPESDFWVDTETTVKKVEVDLTGDLAHRTRDLGIEWGAWRTISSGWSQEVGGFATTRTDQRQGVRKILVPETREVEVGERILDTSWILKIRSQTIVGVAEAMRPSITSLEVTFGGTRMTVSAAPASYVAGSAHAGDPGWYINGATNTVKTDINGFTAFQFTISGDTFDVGEHEIRVDNPNGLSSERTYATHNFEARGLRQTKEAEVSVVTNLRTRSEPVVQTNVVRERPFRIARTPTRTTTTCFLKGTMISVEKKDGKVIVVPIETIKIGDKVKSYDFDSKDHVFSTVTEIEDPIRKDVNVIEFKNEKKLSCTWEHPIYTTRGWASINPQAFYAEGHSNTMLNVIKLRVGDKVFHEDGNFYEIASISPLPGVHQTYNLCGVRPQKNYFADEFLAHNRGGDPIAQTFRTPIENSVVLSSVDLYFRTKDDNEPVLVQLRNVVNGYPGGRIYTYKVLNPSSVNTSTDGSSPTNFRFKDPVVLDPDTEFSFVVYSRSPNYEVWYGELGEKDVKTGVRVTSNPFSGVYFRSANASAWQADGFKDLKFKLRRAHFDSPGTITWNNITGIRAGNIVPHITVSEPTNTKVDWMYSVDGGAIFDNTVKLDDIDLSVVATQFQLRGQLHTEDSYLSPMIHKDKLGIISILYRSDCNYISKNINLDTTSGNVDIYLDEYIPSSAQAVTVFWSHDNGNTWHEAGLGFSDARLGIAAIDDDPNWNEYHYYDDLGGSVGTEFKIRIQLNTSNKAVSPKVRRLRAILY